MATLALSTTTFVARDPDWVFSELHDPRTLVNLVPGATLTRLIGPGSFEARVAIGIGPLHSRFDGTGRITSSDPRRRTASMELIGLRAANRDRIRVRMSMAIDGRSKGAEIRMTFDVVLPEQAALVTKAWLDPIACDLLDRTTHRLKQQLEESSVQPMPPAA